MKLYEKIIFGIIGISIISFCILTLAGNISIRREIKQINSNITRIEVIQSNLTKQFGAFDVRFSNLGLSISSIGTRVSEVNAGLSKLGKDLQGFRTRLPEIDKLVRESTTRILEAEAILSGITD